MHALGLPPRARVRPGLVAVVQQEAVVGLRAGLDLRPPPAAVLAGHVVDGPVDLDPYPPGQGRPDGELDGSGHAGASRERRGWGRRRSCPALGPANRHPGDVTRTTRRAASRGDAGPRHHYVAGDTGTAQYPNAQGAPMSMVRTIVFPALRLLVWAVIAVALVVLAFRGGTGSAADAPAGPGAPTIDMGSPPIPVARGTVTNTVRVTARSLRIPPSRSRRRRPARSGRLLASRPGPVTAGPGRLEIRYEEERDPVSGTDAEGNPTVDPAARRACAPPPCRPRRRHAHFARRAGRPDRRRRRPRRLDLAGNPLGDRDADAGRAVPAAQPAVDRGGRGPGRAGAVHLQPAGARPRHRPRTPTTPEPGMPADSGVTGHRRDDGPLPGPGRHRRCSPVWGRRWRSRPATRRTSSSSRSPPCRARCRPATSGWSRRTANPGAGGHAGSHRRRAGRDP